MKGSIRNILVGTAVVFGLQVLLGILISIYAAQIAQANVEPLTASLRFGNPLFLAISLGSFFVGGLIVGFMEERVVLLEPIVVAALTMALISLAVGILGLAETVFLISFAKAGAWGSFITTVATAIIATVAGALIGERMRTPAEDDALARAAITIGLTLVIVGPFLLMTSYGLPGYVVVIVVLMLLALLGLAYYLFTKGAPLEEEIKDMSISPERQKER